MSRWSPTVIDEGFDLAGILDRMIGGYDAGRQSKKEARSRKLQEEREERDENRYLRSLREGDLARLGARDLAEYLGDPESVPTTLETRTRVGRADQPTVPIAFERPAPTEIKVPGQEEPIMFQERAPHVTASGVVIDPSAARREQTLGTVLDEQMKRRFDEPQPWKPTTREEQIDFTRDTSAAGRAPEKPEPRPTIPYGMAQDAMSGMYGQYDPKSGGYFWPSWMSPSVQQEILRRIMAGEPLPPRPEQMLGNVLGGLFGATGEGSEEKPVEAPAETSEGIGFWNSLRNKFVPGQPYGKEAAAPADTTGMRTALQPGKQAGEVTRYATPSPPEVSPDLTLAQRQEMAAKEWEELVDAGTEPDEATRLLREKYGLPGGQ